MDPARRMHRADLTVQQGPARPWLPEVQALRSDPASQWDLADQVIRSGQQVLEVQLDRQGLAARSGST